MILNKKMMLLLFVQLFLTAAWAQGPNGSKDYYKNADGKMYNLNGQRVSSSYKGIVIMNGKKYVIK